jgi:hypothetical protein
VSSPPVGILILVRFEFSFFGFICLIAFKEIGFRFFVLFIAILLLGACSAQYFNQEEVEASFENDFGDLDAMTKDMDFDEENLLEDAQDEEDPFDIEDD